MKLELTPEQASYVRRVVDDGSAENPEEVLQAAFELLKMQEDFESRIAHAQHMIDSLEKDDSSSLQDALELIKSAFKMTTEEDPFQTFDEWDGEADRKAYAKL